MSGRVIYLAHPVGAGSEVEPNLRRARMWFKWAVHAYPDDVISIPWLVYCETLDSVADRELGLRANLAMLRSGHDAVLLVGGRVSSGMAGERAEGQRLNMGRFVGCRM